MSIHFLKWKFYLSLLIPVFFLLRVNLSMGMSQDETLFISEILAKNSSILADEDGDYSDWIEIYNPTDQPIQIQGYYLTDDVNDVKKWAFPELVIPSKEYLVVYASGKDRADPTKHLHTNFQLNVKGEYLGLYSERSGMACEFSPNYPLQKEDISYGKISGVYAYCVEPTPGFDNVYAYDGILQDPTASVNRGIYQEPISVELISSDEGAQIYYTTDGSNPDYNQGTLYTGPIHFNSTAILRFIAVRPRYISSKIVSKTYIFLENVIAQHEMCKDITESDVYKDRMVEALTSLPSLSIVMDHDSLFGNMGIYENSMEKGREWERQTSVEYIPLEGAEDFQVRAGIRIHGCSSRNAFLAPKHSFRLYFRSSYGDSKLNYPIIQDCPIQSFDSLVLRASNSDSWTNRWGEMRFQALYLRDSWVREAFRDMGYIGAACSFVHLYLNGRYWGVYNVCERLDKAFIASRLENDEKDYEVFERYDIFGGGEIAVEDYSKLAQKLRYKTYISDELYLDVMQYLNIDNFIDYIILNHFVGNTDWVDNNIVVWRQPDENKQFNFLIWDAECTLYEIDEYQVRTYEKDRPSYFFVMLMQNAEFRSRFNDRLHYHFFNDGALTIQQNIERLNKIGLQIRPALIAESARWGGYRCYVHYGSSGPNMVYNVDEHWQAEFDRLTNEYFLKRNEIVLSRYGYDGLYDTTSAPIFNSSGGMVGKGFRLEIRAESSDIYYTIDGSDPRAFGGEVSSNAMRYPSDGLSVDSAMTVTCRAKLWNRWTPPNCVDFLVCNMDTSAAATSLRISELMYNSGDNLHCGDWVEIYNAGSDTASLADWLLKDEKDTHQYAFPQDLRMPPQSFWVISADSLQFSSCYDTVSQFSGPLGFGLGGSDAIRLYNPLGTLVDSVAYGRTSPWPDSADGQGYSLEKMDCDSAFSSSQNWAASYQLGGTPAGRRFKPSVNDVDDLAEDVPIHFHLAQNFPNPFNPSTMLSFDLPRSSDVRLEVFDTRGRKVRTLLASFMTSGRHFKVWNACDDQGHQVPSGLYICRIEAGEHCAVRKMVLIK